jgi:hypothetical protein
MKAFGGLLIATLIAALSSCGSSELDDAILLEDTFNEGYFAAIYCVRRKGGSAVSAARDCEDE